MSNSGSKTMQGIFYFPSFFLSFFLCFILSFPLSFFLTHSHSHTLSLRTHTHTHSSTLRRTETLEFSPYTQGQSECITRLTALGRATTGSTHGTAHQFRMNQSVTHTHTHTHKQR